MLYSRAAIGFASDRVPAGRSPCDSNLGMPTRKTPRPVKPHEAFYKSLGYGLRCEADAGRTNDAALLHHRLHFT